MKLNPDTVICTEQLQRTNIYLDEEGRAKDRTLMNTYVNTNLLSTAILLTSLCMDQMSRHMGKATICLGENKGADQLRSDCEADQRLCFRYSDSTIPLLSRSKFPVSSHLLCLYSPVCVGPVQKPHCWFSHEAA